MYTYKEVDIYIDGASKKSKNAGSGPAGAGVYITMVKDKNQPYQKPTTILKKSYNLGRQTNNVAEYIALLQAVRLAKKLNVKKIHIYSDSQLVVNQMKGTFQVKSISIQKIKNIIDRYLDSFETFDLTYIPRDQNREADVLANIGVKKGEQFSMDIEDLKHNKIDLENQLRKNPNDMNIRNKLTLNEQELNNLIIDF